ncbi:hypothetical protein XENTR_v10010357 [Xenopus tropicalis]|nr:hypothetical protein XENTR_v10010357 [Xenopus tropicalis]
MKPQEYEMAGLLALTLVILGHCIPWSKVKCTKTCVSEYDEMENGAAVIISEEEKKEGQKIIAKERVNSKDRKKKRSTEELMMVNQSASESSYQNPQNTEEAEQ